MKTRGAHWPVSGNGGSNQPAALAAREFERQQLLGGPGIAEVWYFQHARGRNFAEPCISDEEWPCMSLMEVAPMSLLQWLNIVANRAWSRRMTTAAGEVVRA